MASRSTQKSTCRLNRVHSGNIRNSDCEQNHRKGNLSRETSEDDYTPAADDETDHGSPLRSTGRGAAPRRVEDPADGGRGRPGAARDGTGREGAAASRSAAAG
jgi:hypothetical protein